MAVSEQTSVFEMRDMVRPRQREKLTPAKVEQYPFRDIDQLRAALSGSDSHIDAASKLDCQTEDIQRWAEIYSLNADALLAGGGE